MIDKLNLHQIPQLMICRNEKDSFSLLLQIKDSGWWFMSWAGVEGAACRKSFLICFVYTK